MRTPRSFFGALLLLLVGARAAGQFEMEPIFEGSGATEILFAGPDVVFFTEVTPSQSIRLWRSDGDPGGNVLLAEYAEVEAVQLAGRPLLFAKVGDSEPFHLIIGNEDFSTTESLATFETALPFQMLAFEDRVYFSQRDDCGCELWETDGTPVGTRRRTDLSPGPDGSCPQVLLATHLYVFGVADFPGFGREPFVYHRSGGEAAMIWDFYYGPSSSNADFHGEAGGYVYLTVNEPTNPNQRRLWRVRDGVSIEPSAGSLPNEVFPPQTRGLTRRSIFHNYPSGHNMQRLDGESGVRHTVGPLLSGHGPATSYSMGVKHVVPYLDGVLAMHQAWDVTGLLGYSIQLLYCTETSVTPVSVWLYDIVSTTGYPGYDWAPGLLKRGPIVLDELAIAPTKRYVIRVANGQTVRAARFPADQTGPGGNNFAITEHYLFCETPPHRISKYSISSLRDLDPPVPTLRVLLSSRELAILEIDISEDVDGFRIQDLASDGVTVSALEEVMPNRYRFEVRANDPDSRMPIPFKVKADRFVDRGGNRNVESNTVVLTFRSMRDSYQIR